MAKQAKLKKPKQVQALRREAGRLVAALREKRGLTQPELADILRLPEYRVVSLVETGRLRVPVEQTAAWAEALGVDPRKFAKALFFYSDPVTHRLLFGPEETGHVQILLAD